MPVLNVIVRNSEEFENFIAEAYEMGLVATGDTRDEALGFLEEVSGVQIDSARERKDTIITGVPGEFAQTAMSRILAGEKDYEERQVGNLTWHIYDFY